MTYLKNLPRVQRKMIGQARNIAAGVSYLEGGIVVPLNDTMKELVGSEGPKYYIKKMEGISLEKELDGVSHHGACYYEHPDLSVDNPNRMFFASSNNKIYIKIGSSYLMVRDVDADGYAISSFGYWQSRKWMFFSIGDPSMSAKLYRYEGKQTGSITAVADYSGTVAGTIKVTVTGHGLQTGMSVDIAGTTDYDGTFIATEIDADNFYVTETFTSTKTGAIEFHGLTIETETQLEAAKFLSGMEGRMVASGVGANASDVQYSKSEPTGEFDDFTIGSNANDGGEFSGQMRGITNMAYYKNLTFLFERGNIWAHKIGESITVGTTLEKDSNTMETGYSINGFGTSSRFGVLIARGDMYYVDETNGVFSYSVRSGTSGLSIAGKEISKSIRTTLDRYDLSSAALGYYPDEDLLLLSISSVVGGINDTVLCYNFKTKVWSKAYKMNIKQFIWDDVDKQLYGTSSISTKIFKIFDGTYTKEDNSAIKLIMTSIYFDGGRRSQYKEYLESSAIVGVSANTEKFDYKIFIDSNTTAEVDVEVGTSAETEGLGDIIIAAGTWGETLMGSGASREADKEFNFVQYYDFSVIDDHARAAIRIEEDSINPFVIYNPEIIQEVMDETVDSFNHAATSSTSTIADAIATEDDDNISTEDGGVLLIE